MCQCAKISSRRRIPGNINNTTGIINLYYCSASQPSQPASSTGYGITKYCTIFMQLYIKKIKKNVGRRMPELEVE